MANYKRPVTYTGEPLGACDLCGFPYRFPSELHYEDGRFYCLRTCWDGKTRLQDQREANAGRSRLRDIIRPAIPLRKPDWRT